MATKPSKHSSATPTSAPRTSSGSSARSNVLKNRTALLSHCKVFASGRNAIKLRNAIDSDIEHFKFLRQRPVRRIETGEKIAQQSGQRRRIKTYTPDLPTGHRPKHDERYLVSAIASASIHEMYRNRERQHVISHVEAEKKKSQGCKASSKAPEKTRAKAKNSLRSRIFFH